MEHITIFTLHRFGHLIAMNTMMCDINKWLWPYMDITIYNELKKSMYYMRVHHASGTQPCINVLVQFLFENAPACQTEEVLVVSGDILFTQKKIKNWGFTKARLLQDWHHISLFGLEDLFDKIGYTLIKRELLKMIRASTE